jgi:hypothetical protein
VSNNIRQEIENLINQARWQEALDLLNTQPDNPELDDLRSKVEKHARETRSYIEKYIREHQGRYTRASIFDKLVAAGYSELDVRDAFERLNMDVSEKEKVSVPKYTSYDTVSANPLGFLLFFPLIPLVVYFAMIVNYRVFEYIVFIYIAVFLFGTFFPMSIKQSNPSMAKGMIYGFRTLLVLFVVLPIVGLAVLWGICMLTGARI